MTVIYLSLKITFMHFFLKIPQVLRKRDTKQKATDATNETEGNRWKPYQGSTGIYNVIPFRSLALFDEGILPHTSTDTTIVKSLN